MSYEVSTSVWMARIPATHKLVMLYFANVANEDGDCVFKKGKELTVDRLAYLTCLSERTIQRALAELLDEETGFLELVRQATHHSPPEYRVKVERLDAINRITRGDNMTPLRAVEKPVDNLGEKTVLNRGGVTSCRSGVTSCRSGVTQCHPIYKVLDVRDVKSTYYERETVASDLKRLFPELTAIPDAIPTERLFVFWRKVILGQIRKEEVRSPVGFLVAMADEDSGPYLEQYRAALGRCG